MRLLKLYELFVCVQCPLHAGIKLSRVDCPRAVYRVCSVYIRVQGTGCVARLLLAGVAMVHHWRLVPALLCRDSVTLRPRARPHHSWQTQIIVIIPSI